MSSGSASYSVSATNYGRNVNDSYFVLSAPGVQQGNQEITGNLKVDGTTNLVGQVTCGAGLTAAGPVGAASLAVSGASTLTGPVVVGGTLTCTGATTLAAVSVAGLSSSGNVALTGTASLAVAGGVTAASMAASGAVTAASAAVSGAVTAGSLVAAGGYNSFVYPNIFIPATVTPLGPVFTRPCVVSVFASDTTTPTGAGGITQNRYVMVRLSFTNTGTNALTNFNLLDSNPGGTGSNISVFWDSGLGRFTFSNNAAPIDPTTLTFAIMNQA